MEIPAHIACLYRHWDSLTEPRASAAPRTLFNDEALFSDIAQFIRERICIWEKKVSGAQPPYTNDPILARYRFCNILREFDRQTIEFHTLLNPLRDDFPLWLLNMFYCRMVARPLTIRSTGLLSFDARDNAQRYETLIRTPRPRFGTPYVFPISTILKSATPTRELLITRHLPAVMKEIANEIMTWEKRSVYDGVETILPRFGFNLRFLWTEALIDVAYQFPKYIDLFGRFPVGPGALPTLRRIEKREDPSTLAQELARLAMNTDLTHHGKPLRLSAENWEGIACEFRKYTNLKAGRGRKRTFIPHP